MEWIFCKEQLPTGIWSNNNKHLSEEVLVYNGCGISIAVYDRNNCVWYVGEPYKKEWVDDVSWWMPLPNEPSSNLWIEKLEQVTVDEDSMYDGDMMGIFSN